MRRERINGKIIGRHHDVHKKKNDRLWRRVRLEAKKMFHLVSAAIFFIYRDSQEPKTRHSQPVLLEEGHKGKYQLCIVP